jgi:outer membrane protein assembly factor BamA
MPWIHSTLCRLVAAIAVLGLLVTPAVSARDFLPSVTSRSLKEDIARPADMPADEALEQAGAVIGEIILDINDIFATDTPEEDVVLFRLANFLHSKSKRSIIARQLLFQVGEPFSRQKIEESERLLRTQRYLTSIRIQPVAYRDGRVDIKVFTRDVWTLKPGISFGRSGGTNTLGARIEESNLFGFGKQLSLDYGSNVDRTTTILDYRDPQLFGSRWTLATQLGNNSDGRKNGLALERPFYALDTRWSAGLRLLDERRIEPVYDLGNNIDQYRLNQRGATVYYGFSAGLKDAWASRWTGGLTYDDNQFEPAPGRGGPGIVPASRKLVYPWIRYDLTEDRYQRLENLNQIGRTEDLHLGWLASALFGVVSKEIGADRNALIWDTSLAHNLMPGEGQIAELKASFAGRAENARLQNAKLTLLARYFLRDAPSRLTYLSLQADTGVRLDADQRLSLGGDSGLRGYPLRYQAGSGRWIATAEQRFFSDWYPFRLFRVGGAVFFDIGRTWGDNPLGSRSIGVLRDVGLGLRIGQSRSGLGNVVHVNLAFPLDARGDIKKMQFVVETKSSF